MQREEPQRAFVCRRHQHWNGKSTQGSIIVRFILPFRDYPFLQLREREENDCPLKDACSEFGGLNLSLRPVWETACTHSCWSGVGTSAHLLYMLSNDCKVVRIILSQAQGTRSSALMIADVCETRGRLLPVSSVAQQQLGSDLLPLQSDAPLLNQLLSHGSAAPLIRSTTPLDSELSTPVCAGKTLTESVVNHHRGGYCFRGAVGAHRPGIQFLTERSLFRRLK